MFIRRGGKKLFEETGFFLRKYFMIFYRFFVNLLLFPDKFTFNFFGGFMLSMISLFICFRKRLLSNKLRYLRFSQDFLNLSFISSFRTTAHAIACPVEY